MVCRCATRVLLVALGDTPPPTPTRQTGAPDQDGLLADDVWLEVPWVVQGPTHGGWLQRIGYKPEKVSQPVFESGDRYHFVAHQDAVSGTLPRPG